MRGRAEAMQQPAAPGRATYRLWDDGQRRMTVSVGAVVAAVAAEYTTTTTNYTTTT